jgi:hypothetical protein
MLHLGSLRAVARFPAHVRQLESELKSQRQDLERMNAAIEAMRNRLGSRSPLYPLVVRTHANVEALLRYAAIDMTALEPSARLIARRFGLLSQNAEDGITLAILDEIGDSSRRFVDIGCGWNGGNCGVLALELGWTGAMFDVDPDAIRQARLRFAGSSVNVVESRVTRENVDELVDDAIGDTEIDVLSIDIDGNDYWILDALIHRKPRLIIVEYNATLGPDRAVTIPYDPDFEIVRGSSYHGASLAAFALLGRRSGYRLVAVEPRGVNVFLAREDVAGSLPALTPVDAFKPLVPARLARGQELSARAARLAEERAEEQSGDGYVDVAELPN